jgi:hypothetical protein
VTLDAGEVILSGSLVPLEPARAGDRFDVELAEWVRRASRLRETRSVRAASASAGSLSAQREFLDLAAAFMGNAETDLDVSRHLVVRHVLAASTR